MTRPTRGSKRPVSYSEQYDEDGEPISDVEQDKNDSDPDDAEYTFEKGMSDDDDDLSSDLGDYDSDDGTPRKRPKKSPEHLAAEKLVTEALGLEPSQFTQLRRSIRCTARLTSHFGTSSVRMLLKALKEKDVFSDRITDAHMDRCVEIGMHFASRIRCDEDLCQYVYNATTEYRKHCGGAVSTGLCDFGTAFAMAFSMEALFEVDKCEQSGTTIQHTAMQNIMRHINLDPNAAAVISQNVCKDTSIDSARTAAKALYDEFFKLSLQDRVGGLFNSLANMTTGIETPSLAMLTSSNKYALHREFPIARNIKKLCNDTGFFCLQFHVLAHKSDKSFFAGLHSPDSYQQCYGIDFVRTHRAHILCQHYSPYIMDVLAHFFDEFRRDRDVNGDCLQDFGTRSLFKTLGHMQGALLGSRFPGDGYISTSVRGKHWLRYDERHVDSELLGNILLPTHKVDSPHCTVGKIYIIPPSSVQLITLPVDQVEYICIDHQNNTLAPIINYDSLERRGKKVKVPAPARPFAPSSRVKQALQKHKRMKLAHKEAKDILPGGEAAQAAAAEFAAAASQA
jgi:hypothetical protein